MSRPRPDEVALPGLEDLTPLVAEQAEFFGLDEDGRAVETRWSPAEPIDLDELTRVPRAPQWLGGVPVVTARLRVGLL